MSKKIKEGFREYAEALLTALVIAFVIRSFLFEAFVIPSGSMIPTLLVGDHIFVNKFAYGLRLPFTKYWLTTDKMPKVPQRGDAVVFIYPLDESKDFIKRVVGLPGDKIRVSGDHVYVNDVEVSHTDLSPQEVEQVPAFPGKEQYQYVHEILGTVNHIAQFDQIPSFRENEYVVPDKKIFVMGDNRDNSSDSREWGFVPIENIKGRAMFVWLSLDHDQSSLGVIPFSIRWNRFGKWIH